MVSQSQIALEPCLQKKTETNHNVIITIKTNQKHIEKNEVTKNRSRSKLDMSMEEANPGGAGLADRRATNAA